MNSVSEKMQASRPPREVANQVCLEVGDWVMRNRPGTDDPSGTIRIRLGSVEEARRLEQVIQGNIVVIGGERICIQVSNPVLLDMPGRSGNY